MMSSSLYRLAVWQGGFPVPVSPGWETPPYQGRYSGEKYMFSPAEGCMVIGMCLHPAKLGESPVKEIHALEQKLGVVLVAYEKPHPFKKLTAAQIAKIQAAEKDTGSVLVAYEA
jgi:hypothetical protein